ncbi:helix-turn-helix domain-containing protein [Paractinoplanes rhizophilus]|uniref:Helix-turn-helix domain-containing protein n=1 Tax=Paractinoplanes rhizophilus TaxID=1416877 RepID=A0ABW2HYT8_9ACTN
MPHKRHGAMWTSRWCLGRTRSVRPANEALGHGRGLPGGERGRASIFPAGAAAAAGSAATPVAPVCARTLGRSITETDVLTTMGERRPSIGHNAAVDSPTFVRFQLGAQLRRLRDEAKVPTERAADVIEVSASTLRRIESGRVGIKGPAHPRLLHAGRVGGVHDRREGRRVRPSVIGPAGRKAPAVEILSRTDPGRGWPRPPGRARARRSRTAVGRGCRTAPPAAPG